MGGECKVERVKEGVIPVDKLGPENPIVFYQQGSLYEDELDDNGLIQYEYKFRSMGASWFGLIRNYARIDEVAVHIYDTRLYWEEGWGKVARQFMVKTASWAELKASPFDFQMGWNMNPNQSHLLYPHLKERFVDNEYLHFA